MDTTPTSPTSELDRESPQERLQREQGTPKDDADFGRSRILEAFQSSGLLRNDELAKAVGYEGDRERWKRDLWRLHNEGYLKVRWVGLADPDPVEIRLTRRSREMLAAEKAGGRLESTAGEE